jgi:hypothetical protein
MTEARIRPQIKAELSSEYRPTMTSNAKPHIYRNIDQSILIPIKASESLAKRVPED